MLSGIQFVSGDSVFFLVSQFSSVLALFTFVPTTVFSNSSRASLDSLWSWRLAMVGSVCVD